MIGANDQFFIDPSRCIGCEACVAACMECDTHRGRSMIHLEFIDRASTTQTSPVVCMHCESPACAEVCPADAIKQTEDGIVHSSIKSRCIGCSNCVLACPFGVPIADVLRTRMYATDYRDVAFARREYAALDGSAEACLSCTGQPCQGACPHGLQIEALCGPTHTILA